MILLAHVRHPADRPTWQVSPYPLAELLDRIGATAEAVDSTQLVGMLMPSGCLSANRDYFLAGSNY